MENISNKVLISSLYSSAEDQFEVLTMMLKIGHFCMMTFKALMVLKRSDRFVIVKLKQSVARGGFTKLHLGYLPINQSCFE